MFMHLNQKLILFELLLFTSAYSLYRHIAHSLSPGPWRKLGMNDVQVRHYLIAFANIYYFLAILLLKYLVHTSGPNKARVLQQLWRVWFDGKTYSVCYIIAVICKMFACYIQNTLFVLKNCILGEYAWHYINQYLWTYSMLCTL